MKKCSEEPLACTVACDYCKHYDFNANENGKYTGDGWCREHKEQRDPGDGCDDFYCFKVKE